MKLMHTKELKQFIKYVLHLLSFNKLVFVFLVVKNLGSTVVMCLIY